MFSLPDLPREWYQFVQSVREAHGLTQWQVVVLALRALMILGRTEPVMVQELIQQVKEDCPPWTSGGGSGGSGPRRVSGSRRTGS